MKTRLLTLALLLSMMLGTFAACSQDTSSQQTSDTSAADTSASGGESTEAVETQPVADVPEKDFGGTEFRIMAFQHQSYDSIGNFEFWVEKEDGDVVNDAVFRRNHTIEERFNTKITQEMMHNTHEKLSQSVLAGDEPYDIYSLMHMYAGGVLLDGSLYNIHDLEYIDLDKPWWSRELGSGMTINGKLYFVSGDYLLYEKKRTYCLTFNKEMIEDMNITMPYEHVFDDTWTLDVMREMMQGVAADLDGDGIMKHDVDRWGLVLSSYANTYGFLMGADISAVTETKGEYEFTLYSDRLVSMLDKLIAVASDKSIAFGCGAFTNNNWSAHSQAFNGGRALFNSSIVSGVASTAKNAEFDFGVLPMPKYDEEQEYYRTSSDRELSAVIGIPVNDSNPEMTGILLEALSAESHYTTRVAYIETACKTKYTYDERSAQVLDIIFDNTYYNLGTFYNLGDMNTVLRNIIESGSNSIASSYASIEKKAVTELEELLEFFDN